MYYSTQVTISTVFHLIVLWYGQYRVFELITNAFYERIQRATHLAIYPRRSWRPSSTVHLLSWAGVVLLPAVRPDRPLICSRERTPPAPTRGKVHFHPPFSAHPTPRYPPQLGSVRLRTFRFDAVRFGFCCWKGANFTADGAQGKTKNLLTLIGEEILSRLRTPVFAGRM